MLDPRTTHTPAKSAAIATVRWARLRVSSMMSLLAEHREDADEAHEYRRSAEDEPAITARYGADRSRSRCW